jgi:protein SCO1/2
MWRRLCLGMALVMSFCAIAHADLRLPDSLVTEAGKPFGDTNTRDSPVALFFGFTNCPDVCPTTLLDMSSDLAALGDKADGIKMIFVTVDPERDTPEVLQEYLASFDRRITALTGPIDSIRALARTYGASFNKMPLNKGYTMEHSPAVFLIGRDGEVHGIINYGEDPRARTQKLLELLQ